MDSSSMGPTVLDHGHPLTLGVDASRTAAHFLEDLPIRSGTLVEVRLDARSSMFPAQDTWLPVRFESQLVPGPGGACPSNVTRPVTGTVCGSRLPQPPAATKRNKIEHGRKRDMASAGCLRR